MLRDLTFPVCYYPGSSKLFFRAEEIELALLQHFNAVSLGDTRLRTETAGIVAAALLRFV